jgi:acetoacetyl-CoA reductase
MGRVAIVTGGTRGIGRAICERLRDERGCTVIANYAGNDDAAKKFTDDTGIPAVKFDVGDYEAVQAACKTVEEDHGAVDIVVNNAGITRDGTLLKMSYEDWDSVMRTNLGGCFNMAKATFAGMKERGWGRIVNIGSINGQAGQYGQVNYAAAKSGIHGFTKALALEGARFGITVNAIAPGYIDTDMVAAVPEPVLEKIVAKIPVGRLGQASEIARGVSFLCSEHAEFVTGSTMSINGGQHMY